METPEQIPTGHMRFVPIHDQSEGEAHNLTPAKWPMELILVADKEGKSKFRSMERVHDIMDPP